MPQKDFEEYFSRIYQERWEHLKSSIVNENSHCALLNPWLEIDDEKWKNWSNFLQNRYVKVKNQLDPKEVTAKGSLNDCYFLDPGSVLVAQALQVNEGEQVLDLCAAPGGKSLVIAHSLKDSGELWCNEISQDRRLRLKRNLDHFVIPEQRERFKVKGMDGGQAGMKYPEMFDKILVDAPCSGEKHLLLDEKELSYWTLKRSKALGQRQYALLCSALLALKPGGRIVYSTCSINPIENDLVIERLVEKKGHTFDVHLEKHPLAEPTKYGNIFLPDQCGFGPLFYSVLIKK